MHAPRPSAGRAQHVPRGSGPCPPPPRTQPGGVLDDGRVRHVCTRRARRPAVLGTRRAGSGQGSAWMTAIGTAVWASMIGEGAASGFYRRGGVVIFFGTFFTSVSLSFYAAVLEAFWWCRDLLFSVFTAEIQCFSRFHEVRRGMLFLMNFRLLWLSKNR